MTSPMTFASDANNSTFETRQTVNRIIYAQTKFSFSFVNFSPSKIGTLGSGIERFTGAILVVQVLLLDFSANKNVRRWAILFAME